MAMQLMEKNVHEKQDNIVSLRRQLQEMKAANLKMSAQIKVVCPVYSLWDEIQSTPLVTNMLIASFVI